jgi:hypothetical protein
VRWIIRRAAWFAVESTERGASIELDSPFSLSDAARSRSSCTLSSSWSAMMFRLGSTMSVAQPSADERRSPSSCLLKSRCMLKTPLRRHSPTLDSLYSGMRGPSS